MAVHVRLGVISNGHKRLTPHVKRRPCTPNGHFQGVPALLHGLSVINGPSSQTHSRSRALVLSLCSRLPSTVLKDALSNAQERGCVEAAGSTRMAFNRTCVSVSVFDKGEAAGNLRL